MKTRVTWVLVAVPTRVGGFQSGWKHLLGTCRKTTATPAVPCSHIGAPAPHAVQVGSRRHWLFWWLRFSTCLTTCVFRCFTGGSMLWPPTILSGMDFFGMKFCLALWPPCQLWNVTWLSGSYNSDITWIFWICYMVIWSYGSYEPMVFNHPGSMIIVDEFDECRRMSECHHTFMYRLPLEMCISRSRIIMGFWSISYWLFWSISAPIKTYNIV